MMNTRGNTYLTVTDAERIVTYWDKNVHFSLHSLGFFNPCSTFSQFNVKTLEKDFGLYVEMLYDLDVATLTGRNTFDDDEKNKVLEIFLNQLKNIVVSKEVLQPLEKNSFFAIAKELLSKLGSEVMLSHDTYTKMVMEDSSVPKTVRVSCLGLGTLETWHGYPDARVRATSMETEVLSPSLDPDASCGRASPTSSIGDTCIIDGKKNKFNLHQLICTCVVSSFTERNLHGHLSSMIPTVMIAPLTLKICLYDSVQDVLLISNDIDWMTKDEGEGCRIIDTGLILLWMTIHHRFFLKKMIFPPERLQDYCSEIKEKLSGMGVLDKFEGLNQKDVMFKFKQTAFASAAFEICKVNSISPPPLKKH